MSLKAIDKRKTMRRSAYVRLCLVCLCSVLLFAAANASHLRSDWTEDQLYSLSDSTKKVLNALDEPLMIRAYITADLPQPYGRLQRFIEDMLQSYHEAGHGMVDFRVMDPADDANVLASLQALNIPKVQVQIVEDDQAQVKQGYLAIVLEYLDHKEVISVLQSEEGFEYKLTKKIKKITGHGRMKVGIASSFGAHRLNELGRFQAWLHDDYDLIHVDLSQAAVPDDVQAMIVDGMTAAPSRTWRFHLDQFRMRGGGVWVLAGNVRPLLAQGFQVQAIDADANTWLHDDLKVSVEAGLVMDKRAQRVVVRNGGYQSYVEYPFVVKVLDLNDAHVITRDLDALSVPFAAPLLALSQDIQPLLQSSPWTAVQAGPPFDVYPLMSLQKRFAGLQLKSAVLALSRHGAVHSVFTSPPKGMPQDHFLSHGEHGRLLVMGSAAFLDDEFMQGSALMFTLNSVDWLLGDEALIALRSRGVTERPLALLSPQGKTIMKMLWMFMLPLLLILFALRRWWQLKNKASKR